jgi:hypothetical protein
MGLGILRKICLSGRVSNAWSNAVTLPTIMIRCRNRASCYQSRAHRWLWMRLVCYKALGTNLFPQWAPYISLQIYIFRTHWAKWIRVKVKSHFVKFNQVINTDSQRWRKCPKFLRVSDRYAATRLLAARNSGYGATTTWRIWLVNRIYQMHLVG